MNFPKHELLFSKARMNRYLSACERDPDKSLLLYKCNIQASQALYPLISILEVALRNGIDRELSKHFGNNDWLIANRGVFANHPDLVYKDSKGNILPDYFFMDRLKKAEDKLIVRKISITHGKLLSELTFGFWVKFFDRSPIKILKGIPLQAFLNKPHIKLGAVHSHLNSIVILRNRISHNEPICFNVNGKLCLKTISEYERKIMEALEWIDTDLKNWGEKINFFKPVYNRIEKLHADFFLSTL